MALALDHEPTSGPDLGHQIGRLRGTVASGVSRDLAWRRSKLDAITDFLDSSESDLVAALAEDLGRGELATWMADIAAPKAEAAHARRHLADWMAPTKVRLPTRHQPGKAWSTPEPKGVALVISPWNFPVQLSVSPIIGALAAGNTVVLKPSEMTPATSRVLAEGLTAHLGSDTVLVVEGGADVTTGLLEHRFDHLFFTGSPRVGSIVMQAASQHLTPVTLELGGKSPAIVTRHADIEVAARRIAWAKIENSGQICVAPDYVLVDDAVRPEFVRLVCDHLDEFAGASVPLTRIVDHRNVDRLAGLLANHDGVVALDGGPGPDRSFRPVVITDPSPESRLMQEEIFGPILPVLGMTDLDASIDFVSAREKPLALYLFSDSRDDETAVLERTSSGGVVVNHLLYHVLVPELPFGGVGTSGMGTYHGRAGFETFSHRKAVLRKPSRPDLPLIYPPHGPTTRRLLRRILDS